MGLKAQGTGRKVRDLKWTIIGPAPYAMSLSPSALHLFEL